MSSAELVKMFDLFREPDRFELNYNLRPEEESLVVRVHPKGVRLAEWLQWGLVHHRAASDHKYYSIAKAETVARLDTFSDAFRKRRCLIPASGFYEWQTINRREDQPWHIFGGDGQPLVFAGIWEYWKTREGGLLESFAMITCEPNEFMGEIHHRMPVVLGKESWERWLEPEPADPDALQALLVPCPNEWLERTAVSDFVNKVSNNSAECIRPVKAIPTLF